MSVTYYVDDATEEELDLILEKFDDAEVTKVDSTVTQIIVMGEDCDDFEDYIDEEINLEWYTELS
jgi:hypothetical protein